MLAPNVNTCMDMNSRDRIYRLLSLEEADRVGYVDFFWPETIDRWRSEGLPRTAFLNRYFSMDIYILGLDVSPRYQGLVIEEEEEWRIFRNSYGSVVRGWRDKSGPPQPIEPAITGAEDFRELIEPLLDPEDPARIFSPRYPFRGDIERAVSKLQEDFFVFVGLLGPFEYVRHLFGEGVDRILRAFYRKPGDLEYILDRVGMFLSSASRAFLDYGVDGVWVWDDVAYKSGPFFSPEAYRRFIMPQHHRIVQPYRSRNLPAVLHTDGNVTPLIESFIEAGFTAIQPLEAKAGMDVRKLKDAYGDRLAFIGNIDVRVLSSTPERIKDEVVSKVSKAAVGGGYIVGSDHSVPPTVSLDNYRYFLRISREVGKYG